METFKQLFIWFLWIIIVIVTLYSVIYSCRSINNKRSKIFVLGNKFFLKLQFIFTILFLFSIISTVLLHTNKFITIFLALPLNRFNNNFLIFLKDGLFIGTQTIRFDSIKNVQVIESKRGVKYLKIKYSELRFRSLYLNNEIDLYEVKKIIENNISTY